MNASYSYTLKYQFKTRIGLKNCIGHITENETNAKSAFEENSSESMIGNFYRKNLEKLKKRVIF